MDKQHFLAIKALEISDGLIKCQKCGIAVPLEDQQQCFECVAKNLF
jgi:hypothetical protein